MLKGTSLEGTSLYTKGNKSGVTSVTSEDEGQNSKVTVFPGSLLSFSCDWSASTNFCEHLKI